MALGGRQVRDSNTRVQPYRQAVPTYGLSVERGTAAVPPDGCFHVLLRGEELLTTKSEREALAKYRQLRDEFAPAPDLGVDVPGALRRHLAQAEADRFLAQSSREKRARATRKGGKGGSGGVAG